MRRLRAIQKCNFLAVFLRHFFGCRGEIIFLQSLVFLLFIGIFIPATAQNSTLSNYSHIESRDLDRINVKFADLLDYQSKANRIIIAVDVSPKGEIFVLTYGNGIKKVAADGTLQNFISGSYFKSPMDFAINSEGKFYVAVNSTEGKNIKVFSSEGTAIPSENLTNGNFGTGVTGFKGPVGIAFDSADNLYVADHYIGTEQTPDPSRIKIFYKVNGGYINNQFLEFTSVEGTNIISPFRIAVNNEGLIFVADQGSDGKGRVLVIDIQNRVPIVVDVLAGVGDNIGSPGDIVIDQLGFIYIADLGNQLSLPVILNAGNDPYKLIEYFDVVKNGIRDEIFKIRVYNPQRQYQGYLLDQIDLPLDMAIDQCGQLYVNNLVLSGSKGSPPLYSSLDATLDFDLEIYQRTSSADITPPVATCVSSFTIDLVSGGTRTITGDDINVGSFDQCGDVSFQLSKSTFTEADEGPNTVVLTVTDEQGLNSACQVTVQVNVEDNPDTTDPVFENCPSSNINFSTDAGQCGAVINYTIPSATDDSGTVEVELIEGPSPGDFVNAGESVTIIYRATDDAGNTADCTFTISVTDDEDPIITCPENIEETVARGVTEIVINYNPPEYGDNCSIVKFEQTDGLSSGSEFPVGETITNVFVVTDASGKTATCSFSITLTEADDEEDPVITCPTDTEVLTEPGECGAVVEYEFPTATDNGGNPTISIINDAPASGEFFPVGETEIIFEARDESGNTARCTLIITVIDEEPPVFTICPDNEVQQITEENGQYIVPNFLNEVEATDNCSTGSQITYTQSIPAGTAITSGTFIDIFAYDEFNNESALCSFELELVAPGEVVFQNCPEDMVTDNDPGLCGAMVTFETPTAMEGETELEVTQVGGPVSGSLFPVGSTIVTFEVESSTNEIYQCQFEITVNDVEPPDMYCQEDIYTTAAPGETSRVVHFSTLPGIDNCGGPSVVQTDGLPSGSAFPLGTHLIEFTATDSAGIMSSCSFTINVTASEEPDPLEIQCLEDQEIDLQSGCNFLLPDYTDQISVTEGAEVIQSPAAGTLITENTDIILTAELNGETDTCSFEVRLINQAELSINCLQDHDVEADANGKFTIPDYTIYVNLTENCGELTFTQNPAEGTVVDVDTEITIIATDENNSSDECSFNIRLISEEPDPLTIVCPEDQLIQSDGNCELILPNYTGLAQVSDPDAVITQSPVPGTVVSENINITFTATLGTETTSCSFQLFVENNDNIDPVASCVSEFTLYLNEEGYGILSADIIDNGSSDNCGSVEMILSQTRFEDSDVGENIVLLTVTDSSGNTDTCETIVTVVPYEDGAGVTCPEDITISLKNDGQFNLVLNYTGNDENIELEVSKSLFTCDDLGTQVVTATYLGEYTGSCDINVTVIDDISPVANCVQEIDLRLNASGTANLRVEDLDQNSSDNCGIAELSLSQSDFTTADVGTQQVIFTATDGSGNSSTCKVTVNVLPNEEIQPVECVDRYLIQIGTDGRAVLNPRDLFTGGSGTAQYTVSKETFTCNELGENTVTLNYSTPNEEGSCEITIIVEDPENRCEGPTEPAADYIILYPNPSGGLIRFQTSPGLIIEHIEVFDMRGRFLFEKDYESNIGFDNRLDLRAYQSGVYSILISTNGRQFLKRAIIRNE